MEDRQFREIQFVSDLHRLGGSHDLSCHISHFSKFGMFKCLAEMEFLPVSVFIYSACKKNDPVGKNSGSDIVTAVNICGCAHKSPL